MLREYTEEMIKGLVDNPEDVEVTEQVGSQTVLIKVVVRPSDLGCVIGKQGRVINSIRVVLQAAAGRLRKRAIVELIE